MSPVPSAFPDATPVGPSAFADPSVPFADPVATDRAVSNPTQLGIRGGIAQVGADMNNLIGQTGLALGLKDFAADRFSSAANYAQESVDNTPTVNEFGQVKDLTTLTHFVGNMAGRMAAPLGVAAATGGVFRNAKAGVGLGFGVLGAGEQVGTLRADPKVMATHSPKELLGNAAVTGAVHGALFAGPGAPGQLARGVTGIAKGAAGQAVAMGGADLASQSMHKVANPDVQIDPERVKGAAITGAVLGGGLGAAHSVIPGLANKAYEGAAKTASDLRARFSRPKPEEIAPEPPKAETDKATTLEEAIEVVKNWDAGLRDRATNIWNKIKDNPAFDSLKDKDLGNPEVQRQLYDSYKQHYENSEMKPKVDKFIETTKNYGLAIKKHFESKRKASFEEDHPDYKNLADDILSGSVVKLKSEDPKAAALLAKHGYKHLGKNEWAPVKKFSMEEDRPDVKVVDAVTKYLSPEMAERMKGEDIEGLASVLEKAVKNPDHFKDTEIPRSLKDKFGDKFFPMLEEISDKVHGPESRTAAKKAIKSAFSADKNRERSLTDRAEFIVQKHLRPDYRNSPDLRQEAVGILAPKILDYIEQPPRQHGPGVAKRSVPKGEPLKSRQFILPEGDKEFMADVEHAFGKNKDAFLEELEGLRQTREEGVYEPRLEDQVPSIHDELGHVYEGREKTMAALDKIKDKYGEKQHVEIKDLGNNKFSIEAKEHENLTKEDILGLKGHNKGLKGGEISIKLKGEEYPVNVNMVAGTHRMMAKEGQQTQEGGAKYVHDMFSRFMSSLFNSKDFEDVRSNIPRNKRGEMVFPDNMLVAYLHGKRYYYGTIKNAYFGRDKEAAALRKKVYEAKGDDAKKKANKDLSDYYDTKRDLQEKVETLEEDSIDLLQDKGPEVLDQIKETYYNSEAGITRAGERSLERVEREAERLRMIDKEGEQVNSVDNPDFKEPEFGDRKFEDTGRPIGDTSKGPMVPDKEQVGKAGQAESVKALREEYKSILTAAKKEGRTVFSVEDEIKIRDIIDRANRLNAEGKRVLAESLRGENTKGSSSTAPAFPPAMEKFLLEAHEKGPENPKRKAWSMAKKDRIAKNPLSDENVQRALNARDPVEPAPPTPPGKAVGESHQVIKTDTRTHNVAMEINKELDKATGKKFSNEDIADGKVTEAQKKEVYDHFKKTLGFSDEQLGKMFKEFENAAQKGEFYAKLSGEEVAHISLSAADPLSVGYHESLHAIFKRITKADPAAARTLLRAASAPHIVARLRELLKGKEKALAQIHEDTAGHAEERLAYMYQFAANAERLGKKEMLHLGPETQTLFGKIKNFFRKVAAVWSNNVSDRLSVERAGDLLAAFHEGAFKNKNTVAEVIRERFPKDPEEQARGLFPWLGNFMDRAVWTAGGVVRDMKFEPVTNIMDKFHSEVGTQGKEVGFDTAKHAAYSYYLNKVTDSIKSLKHSEQREVLDELRSGTEAKSAPAIAIRKVLDEMWNYMQKKGVKNVVFHKGEPGQKGYFEEVPMERINKNYMPRVYDVDVLMSAEGRQAFKEMLERHGYTGEVADGILSSVTRDADYGKPHEDAVIGMTPFTPSTKGRTLNDIPDSEMAPFLNKDLFGTMSQYVARATRRAEYTERFGNQGQKIQKAREEAIAQGMTEQQAKIFDDSVRAHEGTLGIDMNPKLKNAYGALMTYQNIRLLPLQLFSSLIDPGGIMIRGGTIGDAFHGFTRGIKELFTGLQDDQRAQFAKLVGTIDANMDAHLMSEMANSQYMPKTLRTINDAFFKYNGMEGWNRSMRVTATAAAHDFIVKHAEEPTEHSARYLKELNLTKEDVLGAAKGGKLDPDNPKIRNAINQWVDEAILRPSAANRPIYMSDPNWMLVSHLKQYSYLFQKVLISRVANEMAHGNYTPAYALAGYVPGIIASDIIRMNLTPTSNDNSFRANWTTADWLGHGVARAGLMGPSQLGFDFTTDLARGKTGLESIGGPTLQQLLDFVRASAQGHPGTEVMKAVPGLKYL